MVEALTVLINGQKAYGKEYSVRDTLAYYRMKLESRFTVEQVLYAVDLYTDRRNDIPAPADIISILMPEKPMITQAEYIAAQEWQKRNGYPIFSDAKVTIEQFEAQEKGRREQHRIENEKVAAIESGAVKRIAAD